MRFVVFFFCFIGLNAKAPNINSNLIVKNNLNNSFVKGAFFFNNPAKDLKVITIEFFSDVKCPACQKMHEVILQLNDFLLKNKMCVKLFYRPVVTMEKSVNCALIAAEALQKGTIKTFFERSYPKDKSKISEIDTEAIGRAIGIKEPHKNKEFVDFIQLNQDVLKEKAEGSAPLIIIKNYDNKNHDIHISGTRNLVYIIKIMRQHKIIP